MNYLQLIIELITSRINFIKIFTLQNSQTQILMQFWVGILNDELWIHKQNLITVY